MDKQVHRITAYQSRKISHPIYTEIDKYWLTVKATNFPSGISTAANARDPVGFNRMVYKDVRLSLEGKGSAPGAFDLMNKGITILALGVRLVEKHDDHQVWEITVDGENGGIVDGAHTARIIEQCNEAGTTYADQFVEVYIRTGVEDELATSIARGLNTGIQVAPQSIYNIGGVFDWLKEEIDGRPYASMIAWRESDNTEYDVRDLIGVLELFNIFDWPNDKSKHPISAYEKWSVPLKKFADDYKANGDNLNASTYYRLKPLLHEALVLYDHIRRDYYQIHNAAGGRAGSKNIVEEAGKDRGEYDFPFAQLPTSKYRLTKGACYPMLAAFRNMVEEGSSGFARWRGGFTAVLKLWAEAGQDLVDETDLATTSIGRTPDHLGKSRPHWDKLHGKLQNRLLRQEIEEMRSHRN